MNVRSLLAISASYEIGWPFSSEETPDPSRPLLGIIIEKCEIGDSKLVHRSKLPFWTSGLSPGVALDPLGPPIKPLINSPLDNAFLSVRRPEVVCRLDFP